MYLLGAWPKGKENVSQICIEEPLLEAWNPPEVFDSQDEESKIEAETPIRREKSLIQFSDTGYLATTRCGRPRQSKYSALEFSIRETQAMNSLSQTNT